MSACFQADESIILEIFCQPRNHRQSDSRYAGDFGKGKIPLFKQKPENTVSADFYFLANLLRIVSLRKY
ncbi:MAG: hypothetical protein V1799_06235 [bacterium]